MQSVRQSSILLILFKYNSVRLTELMDDNVFFVYLIWFGKNNHYLNQVNTVYSFYYYYWNMEAKVSRQRR